MEALRRARYKFAGRQKIIVSKKWGFTSLDRADYEKLRREHKVMPDGAYVQVCQHRGRGVTFAARHCGMNTNNQFLKAKGPLLPNLRTAETRAI